MDYVNDVADLHEFNELVLEGINKGMSIARAFDYAWDNVACLTLTDEEVEGLDIDLCVDNDVLMSEWEKLIKAQEIDMPKGTEETITAETGESTPKMIKASTGWIVGLVASAAGLTGGFLLGKRAGKKANKASHLREVRFAAGE